MYYLPLDIIDYILKFTENIRLVDGKIIKKIKNINNNYGFLLKKYSKYNKSCNISSINITIKNTKKSITYYATKFGYRVTLHNENENNNYGCILLYSTITS